MSPADFVLQAKADPHFIYYPEELSLGIIQHDTADTITGLAGSFMVIIVGCEGVIIGQQPEPR